MPRPTETKVWAAISSLKLTLVCLVLLMVLVVACTLAQAGLGTFAAVNIYIRSLLIWWEVPGTALSIPIFPGGGLVGLLLMANLVAAQLKRLEERHKRQHRHARTEALVEGITALETMYRDALVGPTTDALNADRPRLAIDARSAARALDAMEAVEDERQRLMRDAGPGVGHDQQEGAGFLAQRHGDAAGEGELEGIGEQVEDDLLPHLAVEVGRLGRARAVHFQGEPGALARRAEVARQVRRELGQVHGGEHRVRLGRPGVPVPMPVLADAPLPRPPSASATFSPSFLRSSFGRTMYASTPTANASCTES